MGLPILNERGQPTRSEIPDLALPVVVAAIQERGWVWRVGQTTFSKSHHQFEAVVSRIVADDVTGDLEVRTSEYDADSPAEALAWALVEAVSATSEEAKA